MYSHNRGLQTPFPPSSTPPLASQRVADTPSRQWKASQGGVGVRRRPPGLESRLLIGCRWVAMTTREH
ncbi:hypothetical protein E2C01_078288 [Portunus trituberculatus]|uniref:Uncharacterized protein n=1 Tax=Portunus trituberculatus TaxID=210409 RepID=A0A5B7IPQ3_PORTR|nr:hypothetical protein [Portunus trituberculatus]